VQESTVDRTVIFVGWALLPVTFIDGQECPSYNGQSAIDVRGSRQPKVSFSNEPSAFWGRD